MDKIEVGEYVRTEFGNIGRFYRPASESADVYYIYIANDGTKISSRYDSVVKHSFNIIDLIEKGDYVNGKYVEEIKQYESGKSIIALIGIIDEEDIKSIVTKEQFQNIEYRLEE